MAEANPAAGSSEIDAKELTQRVLDRVRAHADAKDVDIVVYCTCGLVCVQPHAFSDALHELLHNAVRATRRGHPVIVDIRDVGEGDVLWQVQDAGEGRSERGLAVPGQDVSIAQAVVEAHGGVLRFESAPGVGTTATIWLPRPID